MKKSGGRLVSERGVTQKGEEEGAGWGEDRKENEESIARAKHCFSSCCFWCSRCWAEANKKGAQLRPSSAGTELKGQETSGKRKGGGCGGRANAGADRERVKFSNFFLDRHRRFRRSPPLRRLSFSRLLLSLNRPDPILVAPGLFLVPLPPLFSPRRRLHVAL